MRFDPSSLGFIDVGALVVVLFFVIMGLVRGFVWQLVRLCAVIGGLTVARLYADRVAPLWTRFFPRLDAPYDTILAYFTIFFLVVLASILVFYLLRNLLAALRLQSYDRLFGGILGVAKGMIVVVVAILLLSHISGAHELQRALGKSHAARLTASMVDKVEPMFPASVRSEFKTWWDEFEKSVPDLAPLEPLEPHISPPDGG